MKMEFPESVLRFLDTPRPMLIGGEWVGDDSNEWGATVNPADGKVICKYAIAGKANVDQAVVAARQAFENKKWSKITPAQRAQLLWKVAELIESNSQELAILETLDGGKLFSDLSLIHI